MQAILEKCLKKKPPSPPINTKSFLYPIYNYTIYNYTSTRRHLDYTSARLRRAVKVSSLFFDRLTDLKTEKTAVFALIRLRNTAVYLFSATSLRIFAKFCTPKCAMYPFVLALPHSHPSINIEIDVSFFYNSLYAQPFLLSIIFYIPFPIQNIIPKHVLRYKI